MNPVKDFHYRFLLRQSATTDYIAATGWFVELGYSEFCDQAYFVVDCDSDGIISIPADNIAFIQAMNDPATGKHAYR